MSPSSCGLFFKWRQNFEIVEIWQVHGAINIYLESYRKVFFSSDVLYGI